MTSLLLQHSAFPCLENKLDRVQDLIATFRDIFTGIYVTKSHLEQHPKLIRSRDRAVILRSDNKDLLSSKADYCSISFKSTPGVTRDPKNHFDISTMAKIRRDTSEIFDIETKIWAFLRLTANFEPCVTLGRFANRQRDA
jgi:hypothetical protein